MAENKIVSSTDTVIVNGITVPAPYRGLMEFGQEFYVADPTADEYYIWPGPWQDYEIQRMWLDRGLVHLTEEAVEAHGRALVATYLEGAYEPHRGPMTMGQQYWIADPARKDYKVGPLDWQGDKTERNWLERGLIYLNEEAPASRGRAMCVML